MKNMKIASKLIVSFALVIAMLIISMGISIFNLANMNEKIEYYSDQAIPVINAMWTGRRAMVATESALYQATTTDDKQKTQDHIDDAQAELDSLKAIVETLRKSYSGDQQDVEKFYNMMESTTQVKEQLYKLFQQNRNEEALSLMAKSYTPIFAEAGNWLVEMANGVQSRVDQYSAEAARNVTTALVMLIGVAVLALLEAVVICIVIVRSLTKPIKEIEQAAIDMSQGILDVEITYQSKDELGNLADKIRLLTHTLRAIITDESELLSQMAHGNFAITSSCKESYVGGFMTILESLREINYSLSDTLAQINESANQVSSGSDQVSSGAQALSQGATEQASAIEELAATINEISQQVKESASNAQEANRLTEDAGTEVMKSSDQMEKMMTAMAEISSSSNEIGKIIKTIEDIAFQTNILALNAAVEAARAGAAGKGFAVVADEVRNLASKSAEASKNTSALIESSIHAVENGTLIAKKAMEAMSSTIASTQQVTTMVSSITTATEEQARSIVQVTQGVDQISSVVQTNSATAEESAAASEELTGQAAMLKNLVGRFRLQTENHDNTVSTPSATPQTAPSHSRYAEEPISRGGNKY